MANEDDDLAAAERFIAFAKRLNGLATGTLAALAGGFVLYGAGYNQWMPAGMVIPVLVYRLFGWLLVGRHKLAAERARQHEQDDLELLEKARQELQAIEESGLSEVVQLYLKLKLEHVVGKRLPRNIADESGRVLPPSSDD